MLTLCKHCDTRHETYDHLESLYKDSLYLFPELKPSFYDLVDKLDCCVYCKSFFKNRFDFKDLFLHIGEENEKKKKISACQ